MQGLDDFAMFFQEVALQTGFVCLYPSFKWSKLLMKILYICL